MWTKWQPHSTFPQDLSTPPITGAPFGVFWPIRDLPQCNRWLQTRASMMCFEKLMKSAHQQGWGIAVLQLCHIYSSGLFPFQSSARAGIALLPLADAVTNLQFMGKSVTGVMCQRQELEFHYHQLHIPWAPIHSFEHLPPPATYPRPAWCNTQVSAGKNKRLLPEQVFFTVTWEQVPHLTGV